MKALTLHQPWASLIAIAAKRIETRSWSTKYRGDLLIHAGKVRPHPVDSYDLAHAIIARDGGSVNVSDLHRSLPLGAVVASCQLIDCIPMVHAGEEGAVRTLNIDDNGSLWIVEAQTDEEAAECSPDWREVTDQLPFGDFTPGRFAWLLNDVKPTTERCPRCWGRGDNPDWPRVSATEPPCGMCSGLNRCPPVPMRGKQGLWNPEWPPDKEAPQ